MPKVLVYVAKMRNFHADFIQSSIQLMRLFLSLLLLGLSVRAFAQQPTSSDIIQPRQATRPATPPPVTKPANSGATAPDGKRNKPIVIPAFPRDWQGKWKGSLNIFTMPNRIERVPMTLEITKTTDSTRYTFAMTYGKDSVKGRRAYEVVTVNPRQGLYVIDEKNSIKLDAYFLVNRLISQYTVQGVRIISTYEYTGRNLIFEVITGRDGYVNTTGGGKDPATNRDMSLVQTFPLGGWQRAILARVATTPVVPAANTKPAKPGKPVKRL